MGFVQNYQNAIYDQLLDLIYSCTFAKTKSFDPSWQFGRFENYHSNLYLLKKHSNVVCDQIKAKLIDF